jgi:hypothetical protein
MNTPGSKAGSPSRIVYVDNNPLVLVHAQALLVSSPEGACAYVDADVRDHDTILTEAAKTLDFTQPVALMLLGIMGHIDDDAEADTIVRRLLEAIPSGSYMALNDGTSVVHPDAAAKAGRHRAAAGDPYRLRSPEQITRFFDDLELLKPGVVSVSRWRPKALLFHPEVDAFCGLGYKP